MQALGWTCNRLAREAGIDGPAAYEFVGGRRDVRAGTLDAMLRALDLRVVVR